MEKQKEYNLRYLLAKVRTTWGEASDRLRQRANKRNKNCVGRLPTSEQNWKIILWDEVRCRIGKDLIDYIFGGLFPHCPGKWKSQHQIALSGEFPLADALDMSLRENSWWWSFSCKVKEAYELFLFAIHINVSSLQISKANDQFLRSFLRMLCQ
jgi:hypothetical protein